MRILGIETSCDETAIAAIDISGSRAEPRIKILSNVIASQAKLHAKFGGVVPHLAKREHQKNLVPILLSALKEAGLLDKAKIKKQKFKIQTKKQNTLSPILYPLYAILERESDLFARLAGALAKRARIVEYVLPLAPPKIDAIAVTVGPGLAPALWVGVNFARALSYLWQKPLIPVNHLEGHIYTNLLRYDQAGEIGEADEVIRVHQAERSSNFINLIRICFPALALIVSGGHTELVLMRRYGDYRVIGETRDDAAGEAFDKVAKMLGLGFPGGPIISRLAEKGNARAFNFPRPMLHSKDFNFSFAGLKTAVLYTLRDLGRLSNRAKRDVAASFEQAVVGVLVAKTVHAARHYRVKTVMLGGGVAANRRLRSQLGETLKASLPSTYYLTPDT